MVVSQNAVVMIFGALVATAGFILLYSRKESAENAISFAGMQFKVSTPALVVFLAGCVVFLSPLFLRAGNQTAFTIPLPWGQKTGPIPDNPDHPGNHDFTSAKPISMGDTVKGFVVQPIPDFFTLTAPGQGENFQIRIIVRKKVPGGFAIDVTVYDHVENKVTSDREYGEDPVTLGFQGNPNAVYYVKVEDVSTDVHNGPYELEVRLDSVAGEKSRLPSKSRNRMPV